MSLLSNLDKILEKLLYARISKFFSDNTLFTPYRVQINFSDLYHEKL